MTAHSTLYEIKRNPTIFNTVLDRKLDPFEQFQIARHPHEQRTEPVQAAAEASFALPYLITQRNAQQIPSRNLIKAIRKDAFVCA
jgi:hypothetical protein